MDPLERFRLLRSLYPLSLMAALGACAFFLSGFVGLMAVIAGFTLVLAFSADD